MTWLEAIVLGIVQGATEFLPISSSGHLSLGHVLLGVKEPELLFDIVLHVGTLVAIVLFYRADVWGVLRDTQTGLREMRETGDWRAFFKGEGTRLALLVAVATVPTGLLGVMLGELIDPDDGASLVTPKIVCGLLVVNGFILFANRWLMDRDAEPREGLLRVWNLGIGTAILVGIAQGLAVVPGISRSGTTITAALLLGTTRANAARFSFLMSIPAILGAVVLKFDTSVFSGGHGAELVLTYLTGAILAGVVGYLCLRWLISLLKNARFHHFSWYCWIVGGIGLIYF